ncbi:MAG: hypothetical protein U0905_17195 [Pirellulales bacterium]
MNQGPAMDNQRKPVFARPPPERRLHHVFQHAIRYQYQPESFTDFYRSKIPIGFGWPMVGVEGMIERETQQIATSPQQLWSGLESHHIVWVGGCIDFAVAIALSLVMFAVTG